MAVIYYEEIMPSGLVWMFWTIHSSETLDLINKEIGDSMHSTHESVWIVPGTMED